MSALAKNDMENLVKFLNDLNYQYELVRNQILLVNPMPSIGKDYNMLLQNER